MKLTRLALIILVILVATAALAQKTTATKASEGAAQTAPAQETETGREPAVVAKTDADSRETRGELTQLLRRYPPQLGTVLKLDPTLLNNTGYLANYPALSEFIGKHPEVAHNPAFFLDDVSGVEVERQDPPEFRMWRQLLGDFGGFAIFLVITSVLIWAIKTLIQQRRWSRLSRIQTEVHSKLLERFTSNEELLAYIQTPAGRRFLESAPIPVDTESAPMSAPLGRIFWSLQSGLVMLAAGVGLWIASARFTVAAWPLFAFAVIAICVGIALMVSAFAFYLLWRRIGLLETPLTPGARGESPV